MNNKIVGNLGEKIAEKILKNSGYKIIDKNFKCSIGEIDIITEKDNNLIFIEVKTRTSIKYGCPSDAVNFYKRNKIIKVAQTFIMLNKKYINFSIRFDVFEIFLKPSTFELNKINHIKNAFTL
ncbi:MAG: YraN family protein [Thermoanaerobacteraceae bacterium]|nr:YraN family protein [Thermoanaerobacteraceae bacterium]